MSELSLHDVVAVGLGIGLVTIGFRLGFAELRGRSTLPRSVLKGIGWVPVAALAAIVAPSLVPAGDSNDPVPSLLAALVAGGVAFRTRNLLLSLALGMTTYQLARG